MSAPDAATFCEHRAAPAHDAACAGLYRLVAALLLEPPPATLWSALAAAPPAQDDALGDAWQALTAIAATLPVAAAEEEHAALFVALGKPRLDPRASRYRPAQRIAELHAELRRLGITRRDRARHGADHLGALCEALALLHADGAGDAAPAFFRAHVAPWYADCLRDVARADGARVYRCIAGFAHAVLDAQQNRYAE